MSAVSQPATAARGIYWADYTLDGKRVMYGVSSSGEIVACLSVPPGHATDAACLIQQKLDTIDPRPLADVSQISHLRLLRAEPAHHGLGSP